MRRADVLPIDYPTTPAAGRAASDREESSSIVPSVRFRRSKQGERKGSNLQEALSGELE
jgi:hypothetical protein